ncbi:MAG: phenylacetate-CoA oxygenase subunit PaaC [Ardenticatenaceae bacterium]|nr:phenylacetate-CoA oxygenase subunit PaaC [Ardenticatenaceae bacterium]
MSDLSETDRAALVASLTAIADDEMLLGHRASEWTGLAPVLEADIALSSIAQDEMGHARTWYGLLEPLTGQTPDWMVFVRPWQAFRNAQLSELPRGDWGFTLIRHYLHDVAEQVRLEALAQSTYAPSAQVARKLRVEEKYHLIHGQTWIAKLGRATEESRRRMQTALDQVYPYALGLFEPPEGEEQLVRAGIVPASADLLERWQPEVVSFLADAGLTVPATARPVLGGRRGEHSEHLEALVGAMQLLEEIAPPETW